MILIEKAYLFLWIYTLILGIISILNICVNCLQIPFFYIRSMSLSSSTVAFSFKTLELAKRVSYSDWYVITLIKNNTEPILFDVFLSKYLKELKKVDGLEERSLV